MESLPSGNAQFETRAVLHMDGVGFSVLIGRDDPQVVLAVERQMKFASEIIIGNGGTVHSHAGDALMASFPRVSMALLAALALQTGEKDAVMRLRVGVHIGEVYRHGDVLLGNAVNIAARIEPLAAAGQIIVTRAVKDVAPRHLPLEYARVGEVTVKNIEEPIELFSVVGTKDRAPRKSLATGLDHDMKKRLPCVLVRGISVMGESVMGFIGEAFQMDLISKLARFRHLDVISHSSSALLPLSVPNQIAAQQVNASYVVSGQLQVVGHRLKAVFELSSGESGKVYWSESMERQIEDVFALQFEIVETVVSTMAIHIEDHESRLARARDPDSLDCYALFCRGRIEDIEDGVTGREASLRASEMFRRAIALDGDYSAPVAGLSRVTSVQWRFNWCEDRERHMELALQLAQQALEIDPNDPVAFAELGFVTLYRKEHDRSLAAYRRAIELNPSDADILAFYADALKHSGEVQQSIPLFERALRLNPLKPDIYLGNMAHAYCVLEDYDKAIALVRQMRQPMTAQRLLTAALMLSGREAEARNEAARLRKMLPDFSARAWLDVVPDRHPGYSAKLIEGLERAGF